MVEVQRPSRWRAPARFAHFWAWPPSINFTSLAALSIFVRTITISIFRTPRVLTFLRSLAHLGSEPTLGF
jgi:hypothetical protein